MTKYKRYQDYVIKDGKLVGEFEEMYQDFDDPYENSEGERFASEKAVCINLIESLPIQNVVDLGCGFGQLTNRIQKVCPSVTGLDLSPTAIKKASTVYPNCNFLVSEFPDLDLLRKLAPDCIVMAEITWYVLDQLDGFIEFLRDEMPNTYLIHMLMTYADGEQKYGAEKFTNLATIKDYFGMNYTESGEVQHKEHNGGKRTYFIGKFS